MVEVMERPRPPMMTAPDRSKPSIASSPRMPISLKAQAEAVVVQAAKEWVDSWRSGASQTATAAGEIQSRLIDAVRVLRQLES
jgi:hypothetical protein